MDQFCDFIIERCEEESPGSRTFPGWSVVRFDLEDAEGEEGGMDRCSEEGE